MTIQGGIAFKCTMNVARTAVFTPYHINASELLANSALKIEKNIKEQPSEIQQKKKEDYIAYSGASIISSVSAIEANINEILVTKKNTLFSSSYQKDKKLFDKYAWLKTNLSIWDQLQFYSSIMPKHDIISFLLTGKFISHNLTIENTKYLILIRNSLIHFTPEREDQLIKHKRINTSKKNRFNFSPLFEEGHILFPHRIICADCAKWGNKTAISFMKMFNELYNND